MKNVWRRTLSLVLSGVLLLGSVPVQAFATEEVVEEVLEEVVTEPQTTQQTQSVVTATDEVANTGVEAQSNPKIDYPLVVNGEQINSDQAADILENGTAVFGTATSEENVTTNTLTLTDAEVESAAWLYYESHKTLGPELTVYLPEGTESTITEELKTEGDLPADIRITGKGKLNVGSMEVTGSLTVEDAVICVTGDAHFVIGAGKMTDEGAENVGTLIGNGYYRTAENDVFTAVTEKTGIPVTVEYLEFISADHLAEGYVQTDDGKHYKICNDSECPLIDDEKPECAEHTTTSEATCAAKAVCSVCGEYGDVNADNCIRSATKYKIDETNHELVYSCCNATIEAAEPHDCEYVISEDQTSMVLTCKVCKHESDEPIAITAPVGTVNGEVDWNNGSHPVTVNHADAKITYFKDSVPADKQGGEETAPTAPGKYIALVEVKGQELRMEFVIKQKELTACEVTLSSESVAYDGRGHSLPEVTVKDGQTLEKDKDYDVVYTRDNVAVGEGTEATVNAGVIKVTVTGKGNYTGTVEKTFTIEKASATAALFTFTPPAEAQLVYNGNEKVATLAPKSGVQGLGTTEVLYYKKGETDASRPKDAGVYDVKISVKGTENYKEAMVSDESWTFEILPVSLTDENVTAVSPQTVIYGDGNMAITEPTVSGVNGESATGALTYRLNDGTQELKYDELITELKKQPAGSSVKVSCTFTANGNYNGTFSDEIIVNVVALTFTTRNENNEEVDAANAVKVLPPEKCIFGQDGIVTLDPITAREGTHSDENGTYTVKYRKGTVETDAPSAGNNEYTVYYTGTIDGVRYENVKVCSGNITVNPRVPVPTAPVPKTLVANGQDQVLADVGAAEIGEIRYSQYQNGNYTTTIPSAKNAGAYYVWYKEVTPGNDNYADSEPRSITVVIAPELKAVYGQTLKEIENQLPAGFAWYTTENPETDPVGNVGPQTVELNYEPTDKNNYPTITDGYAVPLTVSARRIKITEIALSDTHMKYSVNSSGAPVERKSVPIVKYLDETQTVDDAEATAKTLPEKVGNVNNYTITYSNNVYPGIAQVSIASGSNYEFVDGSVTTAEFVIYRPGPYGLSIVPDTLKATYADVDDLKEALVKGLEDEHDEKNMDFFNVKMQIHDPAETDPKKVWSQTTEEFYCPEEGFTFEIKHPTGTNKSTKFEAVGISTMQNGSREVVPVEVEVKDESLVFTMENYAVVCLAWDGYNENSTFKVTTSATNGTVKFTVGTETTSKTKADAVKVGEKITVTATPKSGYALTGVKYTYNSGAFSVKVEQDSNGKYVFEMPAKDINITATFSKKTTNTKNPYSGDTSHIYLWLTMMAASVVGIVALVILWIKKRRK